MPEPTVVYDRNLTTALPSVANVLAILGIASHADTSRVYTYDPGAAPSDIRTDLGDGMGVEALVGNLTFGKRRTVFVPMPADVAGSIGAVTKVRPSNPLALLPTITATATAAGEGNMPIAGPWDSLHICLKVTASGASGVAKFSYALDDQEKNGTYNHIGTFSGDIIVPAATKAELIGTIDLSTIADPATTLNTLEFIVDSDSDGGTPVTTTFATPANVAAIVSQISAGSGSGSKYTVALVGANKLQILSATAGGGGTLTITGNAATLLGFTVGQSATGGEATYTIPNTGIVLAFASGNYALGDLYTFSTTAPKYAPSSLAAAFTRLRAAAADGAGIGGVWAAQEDSDAIDARVTVDALYVEIQTAQTAGFDWWGMYQAPRPTKASDGDVLTYLGDKVARFLTITARAVRCYGGLLTGSRFHRPASWIAAWRASRERWSSDLGNHSDGGETTETGLTELDGDERTASIKLATYRTPQTGDGGGFTVMDTPSNQSGVAHFWRGRTMAAFGDILGDLNACRLALACGRQARFTLSLEQNNDDLPTFAGDLSPSASDRIEQAVRGDLDTLLFADSTFQQRHAAAIGEIVPSYSSGTLSVTHEIQRQLQFKAVLIRIGVVDAITVSEA